MLQNCMQMGKTFTDFSQLSKGLFKKAEKKTVEVKPEPVRSKGDEDVLAYFSRRGDDSAKSSPAAPRRETGRESTLEAECAELRVQLEQNGAEIAAATRDSEAAASRVELLGSELQKEREAHMKAERERTRLEGECGRLKGELRRCAEKGPGAASSEGAPVARPKAAKPTRALVEASGAVAEVFAGEERELVLGALSEARDAARQSGRERRAAVLDNVLSANLSTGELERRRAALKQVLKDAGAFNDASTLSALRELGFQCISGRKHWKLEYGNVRMPIAKTPSDYRASKNTAAVITNLCF